METTKPKVLFVLGGPGSGKGTQCDNLVKKYKFVHFSTGDLLRAEVKKATELGQKIDSFMSKGNLVPGDVAVTLIKNNILEGGTDNLYIIDGYPRNQSNIDFWESVVKDSIDVIGCLNLNCSKEVMLERVLNRGKESNRSDDNEEIFKNRMEVFENETLPIVDYFKSKNKLYDVSAEGTKEECFALIQVIISDLGLEKIIQLSEMKNYLSKEVDCYIKPLIVYLMKNKPKDVHEAILYWMNNEGKEVKKTQESKKDKIQ